MTDVHYLGTVYVTKAAWPHLMAAGYGRVVNTTSESMLGNTPKSSSYAGAKGAIFGFTRGLALDGMRHGIQVNAIAPRGITRAHDHELLGYVYDVPPESFNVDFFLDMKPEYVSPAVAYLAHESCQLNGEVLVAGSGQVMDLVVVETKGIARDALTLEDVAENIAAILDQTDTQVQSIGVPQH